MFLFQKNSKYLTGFLVLFFCFVFSGCGDKQNKELIVEKEKKEEVYNIAQVDVGDVVLTKRIEFTYSQKDSQTLKFQLDGYSVRGVYVKKGDTVKKGDLLAEIDFPGLPEILEEIEHDLSYSTLQLQHLTEQKELELGQTVRMLESGETDKIGAQKRDEEIEKEYDEKMKEFKDNILYQTMRKDYYSAQVESGRLYAEMDGTVGFARSYAANARTSTSQIAVQIYDSGKCAYYIDDIENARLFEVGQEYIIRSLTGKGFETIYRGVEEDSSVFELKETDYALDINSKGYMVVNYEVEKDVVRIPERCLHKAGELYYVYYVDENNIRSVQYVEPGLIGDDYAEIKSGIKAGDIIVKR